MKSNATDEEFYLGEGNEPQILACLLDPHLPAMMTYSVPSPNPKYKGVRYGLCVECIESAHKSPSYQQLIDDEIEIRLKKLGGTNESE